MRDRDNSRLWFAVNRNLSCWRARDAIASYNGLAARDSDSCTIPLANKDIADSDDRARGQIDLDRQRTVVFDLVLTGDDPGFLCEEGVPPGAYGVASENNEGPGPTPNGELRCPPSRSFRLSKLLLVARTVSRVSRASAAGNRQRSAVASSFQQTATGSQHLSRPCAGYLDKIRDRQKKTVTGLVFLHVHGTPVKFLNVWCSPRMTARSCTNRAKNELPPTPARTTSYTADRL